MHEAETELLARHLACPVCKSPLPGLTDAVTQLRCPACNALFSRSRHAFDFTPPPEFRKASAIWDAWDQIQANGLATYIADPDRNLSVGEREDCRLFQRFCASRGLALDIGCGPQAWPAYFSRAADVTYVGIDPLADVNPSGFLRFIGLGEFLPFAAGTFDHVLFSTTLDHFVDPASALREAARVLKPGGEIDVWLGEKDPAAPKPAVSPEWYQRLQRPELADDLFHIKRMSEADFQVLIGAARLTISEQERHQIDQYRANCFYRLRVQP